MRKIISLLLTIALLVSFSSFSAFADYGPGARWELQEDGNWKVAQGKNYVTNSWFKYKGLWYLFDSNSNMIRGWVAFGGHNYYLSEGDSEGHPDGSLWVSTTTPDGHQVNENGECIGELRGVLSYTGQRANPYGYSCIEVCLGEQAIYVYVDNALVLSSPCVTGRPTEARRTPVGEYQIYAKEVNRTLKGANEDGSKYESFVNYWMPFQGGYGLHDATWRGQFGGKIYTTNGSHGCVNLPLDVAAALYNICWIGMPVIVHD